MKREQFTFYESFRASAKLIKKPAVRAIAYDIICDYALYGIEPDIDALPSEVAIAFINAKPNLDASRRKAENGKRGGDRSKAEAKGKQTEATDKQTEAKGKQGKVRSEKENEKEGEIEKENECSPPTPSSESAEAKAKQSKPDSGFEALAAQLLAGCGEELITTVEDWLKYKREKRQSYGATGMKTLLGKIRRFADSYGEQAVIGVIRDSMSNSYQGIVWDRLEKGGGNGNNTAGKAGVSAGCGQYTCGAIRYD